MTIVVVGIVAIPLSLLLSQHIQSIFQSEDLTIARQLARLEMEKVNNMSFASIIDEGDRNFSPYEEYNYDLTRDVEPVDSSGGESIISITVEVTRQGDSEVLISLITYIVDNITFGI